MKKISLDNVTLVGIDCIDVQALSVASEFCQKYIQFGQVKLLSHLPCDDPHLIKIDHLNSHIAYNYFVMKKLYKYIDTEYLIIFQTDGFILNPLAWSDEFLLYDYIGAPWWYDDDCNVGNGGFSLRTRRIIEVVALDDSITDCGVEDHSICRTYGRYLKNMGFTFAPDDVARKFSVEQEKWNGQFGFHDTDISNWDIYAYADKIRHAKYIDKFNKFYRKGRYESSVPIEIKHL